MLAWAMRAAVTPLPLAHWVPTSYELPEAVSTVSRRPPETPVPTRANVVAPLFVSTDPVVGRVPPVVGGLPPDAWYVNPLAGASMLMRLLVVSRSPVAVPSVV